MEVKKLSIAIAFIIIPSSGFALLSDVINKPADRSLLERFIYFTVIFSVMFVASAMWEGRKQSKKK